MAVTFEEQKTDLLNKLAERVRSRQPAATDFVRKYYANVAPEDIRQIPLDDLYGAALSHWNLANERAIEATLVRAYNPDFDQHGWQSTHSVIEIVTDDKPFLVDSVVMELNRHGLRVHLVIHPVIPSSRHSKSVGASDKPPGNARSAMVNESLIHCEIDRQDDGEQLDSLAASLRKIISDVEASVTDWPAMRAIVDTVIQELSDQPPPTAAADTDEVKSFLNWLADNRFILLGYRNYDLVGENGSPLLRVVPNSGLGVLRDDGSASISSSFAELPAQLRELARAVEPQLIISKSSARATVHRPGHMDYVGVKRYDSEGRVSGEHRFLGLYTSAAYNLLPRDIPLLRRKVETVIVSSGLDPQSHAGKALVNILDTLPRDELFQMNDQQLATTAMGILHLQERQTLRLFVREDLFRRFVSCLVYVPRDRYDTSVRLRMQAILSTAFAGTSSTFATQFSESVLARVQFHIRTDPLAATDYTVSELETKLREALLSWDDEFGRNLTESRGEARGNTLLNRYGIALPAAYKEDFNPRTAVSDVARLETLNEDQPLAMRLYRALENPDILYLKVFGRGQPMALSDALPILERLGLRVISAHPYELQFRAGEQRWILTFDMREDDGVRVDIDAVQTTFRDAFSRVWNGNMENDELNRLVMAAGMHWRDVAMLRAYCKYLLQTRVPFSQNYMQQTIVAHAQIAAQLVTLFHARFDPNFTADRASAIDARTAKIEQALEAVESLDEDRILRRFLAIIQATLRTNYFQTDHDNAVKDYLSLKFDPALIPELPLPLPMYEIFVYSPRVEAVHLRGGPAARGGLRWSDRREDFRTEVLGLMKAQMVKNAVIVPVGSKGGFVVKRPPGNSTSNFREALQKEVRSCYTTFIRGMLDITDNRIDGQIQPPESVVRHDADDPYLVVAADKGTATFSDLANSVALDYGYWLGDAFASGGENGYDHKKMGITARGAWESVKRHFRELDRDIQGRDDFTVVGIGDMSGDVFGNGMLLSPHIKLLAAFNHLHIFLDPGPDVGTSLAERERLFALPRSGWNDYNPTLISAGGGVFSRTAKSITLSPEVRKALDIDAPSLTPQDLINRILKAPVDLLWNGGIGTYVKASNESHADADDRNNDGLRVDGRDLRCQVIGEGGNLGLTQLGRVEFAMAGGKVLTDAIDNSAGVNCSDHEVNIKILLNQLVGDGDMTEKQRNNLLAEMTDDVAELVLRQNYLQPEAISITLARGDEQLADHIRAMRMLERSGRLNRSIEFLPDDEVLAERASAGNGLTGPELAVLLAYTKMMMFDAITASDLPEDPYLQVELASYFPSQIRERHPEQLANHPLGREIISTYVTNSVLNRMGSAYLIRLLEDSGEGVASIARAYSAARDIFNARDLWLRIDSLDTQISSNVQIEMHWHSRRLLERTSLWLLRNRRPPLEINDLVGQFRPGVDELRNQIAELLPASGRAEFDKEWQELTASGVPNDLAKEIASLHNLGSSLDIIEVAEQQQVSPQSVAEVYFSLAGELDLDWLRDSVGQLPIGSYWQRRARAALLNNLYSLLRSLANDALRAEGENTEQKIAFWLDANRTAVERSRSMFNDLRTNNQQPDLAMLSVALRETGSLIQGG